MNCSEETNIVVHDNPPRPSGNLADHSGEAAAAVQVSLSCDGEQRARERVQFLEEIEGDDEVRLEFSSSSGEKMRGVKGSSSIVNHQPTRSRASLTVPPDVEAVTEKISGLTATSSAALDELQVAHIASSSCSLVDEEPDQDHASARGTACMSSSGGENSARVGDSGLERGAAVEEMNGHDHDDQFPSTAGMNVNVDSSCDSISSLEQDIPAATPVERAERSEQSSSNLAESGRAFSSRNSDSQLGLGGSAASPGQGGNEKSRVDAGSLSPHVANRTTGDDNNCDPSEERERRDVSSGNSDESGPGFEDHHVADDEGDSSCSSIEQQYDSACPDATGDSAVVAHMLDHVNLDVRARSSQVVQELQNVSKENEVDGDAAGIADDDDELAQCSAVSDQQCVSDKSGDGSGVKVEDKFFAHDTQNKGAENSAHHGLILGPVPPEDEGKLKPFALVSVSATETASSASQNRPRAPRDVCTPSEVGFEHVEAAHQSAMVQQGTGNYNRVDAERRTRLAPPRIFASSAATASSSTDEKGQLQPQPERDVNPACGTTGKAQLKSSTAPAGVIETSLSSPDKLPLACAASSKKSPFPFAGSPSLSSIRGSPNQFETPARNISSSGQQTTPDTTRTLPHGALVLRNTVQHKTPMGGGCSSPVRRITNRSAKNRHTVSSSGPRDSPSSTGAVIGGACATSTPQREAPDGDLRHSGPPTPLFVHDKLPLRKMTEQALSPRLQQDEACSAREKNLNLFCTGAAIRRGQVSAPVSFPMIREEDRVENGRGIRAFRSCASSFAGPSSHAVGAPIHGARRGAFNSLYLQPRSITPPPTVGTSSLFTWAQQYRSRSLSRPKAVELKSAKESEKP
ncbi:unnamed protein product [Amoebophrya sp. A120]|nr:unnamed protein product [Amoebophrya sp. A120]|eukprot:GSA120T00011529001.1